MRSLWSPITSPPWSRKAQHAALPMRAHHGPVLSSTDVIEKRPRAQQEPDASEQPLLESWCPLRLTNSCSVQNHNAQLREQEARLKAQNEKLRAQERLLAEQNETLAAQQAQKAQIEAQAAQLLEVDAAKSRFFTNLSHEFRTPLTLIIGPLKDLLAADHATINLDDHRHQFGGMLHHAQSVLRLINQLLDLSRLEAKSMPLRVQQADLVAFARNATAAFAPLAEARQITLSFQAHTEPLPIYFDAEQLEKVVVNLLGNALKFTPVHGRVGVKVRLDEPQQAVQLIVRDTGQGIAADDQPHVFDRFYRGRGVSSATGTGIGLALVKEMVALHGGTIDVESMEGFGSTFTVTLPLGRAHFDDTVVFDMEHVGANTNGTDLILPIIPQPVRSDRASTTADRKRPTVLIVEDNRAVRGYIRDVLGSAYHILEAEDGNAGLELARTARPDLVVSDVMMPELDGFSLCARLRGDERTYAMPVLMLTAKSDMEHQVEALKNGADGYLTKPFDPEVLRARVARLIAVRRRLGEKLRRELVLKPTNVVIQPEEEAFLERVCTIIETHIADESFSVTQLAEEVGLSSRHLQRRLKASTGLAPRALIRSLRLERAVQLLAQDASSIADIAYAVGFSSVSHFTKCFRDQFGQPPSVYSTAS